jgi:hypothetical protein
MCPDSAVSQFSFEALFSRQKSFEIQFLSNVQHLCCLIRERNEWTKAPFPQLEWMGWSIAKFQRTTSTSTTVQNLNTITGGSLTAVRTPEALLRVDPEDDASLIAACRDFCPY